MDLELLLFSTDKDHHELHTESVRGQRIEAMTAGRLTHRVLVLSLVLTRLRMGGIANATMQLAMLLWGISMETEETVDETYRESSRYRD